MSEPDVKNILREIYSLEMSLEPRYGGNQWRRGRKSFISGSLRHDDRDY